MELRLLTAADRERITALFLDVFTRAPWNDDWSDRAQLDAYIADLTGQGNSLALGYFDGTRLTAAALGCVKHWYSGTEYCVDEFFVARELQGRGIGRRFLAAIEAYLKEKAIRRIFLQTERTVPAYCFYRANGFEELEDHVSFTKEFG